MRREVETFLIPALLVLGIGTFLLCLLAPLWTHMRWERGRRRRDSWRR